MIKSNWLSILINFLHLTHEKEDNGIIKESIEKGIIFRGTNLWILIFAILIASVGLNMNSTAVIIGAMLISPLMGPITGVGYSVATYNYPLFKKSLLNFGFAISAALVTSTLYFVLTPIHTEHSEILSRTSPTIYDVLIGFFGGLAGIVAISSKNKGNVIPGVAIATALMPPLCTAGYGISIGNWGYFLGAMYLFIINSVFIALSAMIVSQLLKLPKQTHLLSKEIKNKNIAIASLILVTIVPSFYLGLTLVKKENFVSKAESFVAKIGLWEGNYLLSNTIDGNNKTIRLVYGGNEFDEKSKERLYEKAKDLELDDAKLVIEQGLKIKDVDLIQKTNDEFSQMQGEMNLLKSTIINKEKKIDSISMIPKMGESLLAEIQPMFPSIRSCSFAITEKFIDSLKTSKQVNVVVFETKDSIPNEEQLKIYNWLKSRLKSDEVILKF